MTGGWISVVAGALARADGRWLMHQRPAGKHHAGQWEFPGGKVEDNEMPLQCLMRELTEELGIVCDAQACTPAGFATHVADESQSGLVILLYTVTAWNGEPQALEGGAIGWFTPAEALALDKPPLDVALAARLFTNIPI